VGGLESFSELSGVDVLQMSSLASFLQLSNKPFFSYCLRVDLGMIWGESFTPLSAALYCTELFQQQGTAQERIRRCILKPEACFG